MSETEPKEKKPTGRPKGSKDKQPRKKRTDITSDRIQSSPIYQDNVRPIPKEYNARRIAFLKAIEPTEPLDMHDVAEMERRFNRYLDMCVEYEMKVGNLAAYFAIGIDKDQVHRWVEHPSSDPARATFAKKVRQICSMYREGLMEDGKINPVTGIFWQKNYDGLQDQKETVVTARVEQQPTKSADELAAKYLESAGQPQLEDNGQIVDAPDFKILPEQAEKQKNL